MLGSRIAAVAVSEVPHARVQRSFGPGHYTVIVETRQRVVVAECNGPSALVTTRSGRHRLAYWRPSYQSYRAEAYTERMRYEVWELRSRSLVAAYQDEDEALALARRLVDEGWSVDDLVVGADDESVDVDALPPSLTGRALAARLADLDVRRAQRSA